jgi:uncharacterized membrane protein
MSDVSSFTSSGGLTSSPTKSTASASQRSGRAATAPAQAGASHQVSARRRHVGRSSAARTLGWLSVGLGIAQLLAPRRLARLIGVSDGRRAQRLMRATGAVTAVAGITLLRRSAQRQTAADKARQPVRRSITVAHPVADVYRFWRDFQNLPKFMVHLDTVETLDATHSYWRARSVAGKTFEWNAEVVEERENELIRWRTMGDSQVAHGGVVRFLSAPGGRGTEIHVEFSYDPPGGVFGRAVALAVGQEPSQQVEGDLRRLKAVLETGEIVESDASIHRGRHPARPSVMPKVRKHGGRS